MPINELPESLKYGPFTVHINYDPALNKKYGAHSYGCFDLASIDVQGGMKPARVAWHVWRQVLHQMFQDIAVDMSDERWNGVAGGLWAIIRDNPLVLDVEAMPYLPSVRVCGCDYELVFMPGAWDNTGELSPESLEIRLNGALDPIPTWLALLHELIHAACDSAGVEEFEEDVVRLTHVLGAFITDNDLSWLTNG